MAPCPKWEYESVAAYQRILLQHYTETLEALKQDPADSLDDCCDTRDLHGVYFSPAGFAYYAGNYRGASFKCLRNRRVEVQSDSRVGTRPREVSPKMGRLAREIQEVTERLDRLQAPREEHLLETVTAICDLHVKFLTVHPYLNGNGHMARFILIAILGRYGYWLAKFPIEPKPPGRYYDTLKPYRDGNKDPLLAFVLDCFSPP